MGKNELKNTDLRQCYLNLILKIRNYYFYLQVYDYVLSFLSKLKVFKQLRRGWTSKYMKFIFIFLWPPFLLLSFPQCHPKPTSTDIPRNYLDNILHPEFLYPSLPIRGTLASPHGPIPCFFKKIFCWCGVFKVFIDFFFFTILLLFYILCFFGQEACGILAPTRDWIRTSCIGKWSLSHWTTRKVPCYPLLLNVDWTYLLTSGKYNSAEVMDIISTMRL